MKIAVTSPRAPVVIEWIKIMQRSGHDVTVVDSLFFPITKYYNNVNYLKIASPKLNFEQYKKDILKVVENHDFVIPTCEDIFYLSIVLEGNSLRDKVFIPDNTLLFELHNKFIFGKYMNSFVKVPEMRRIENKNDFDLTNKNTILKPVYSRFGRSVIREVTSEAIKDLEVSLKIPWVQQQFIKGQSLCNFAILQKGEVITHVVYKPKYLVNNAASTYFETTQNETINNFIKKFGEDTKYNGQVAFDFIDDGKDVYVIECNPRATSGLHLVSNSVLYENGKFISKVTESIGSGRVGKSLYFMFGIEYLFSGRWSELKRDYMKAVDVIRDLPLKAQLLAFIEIFGRKLYYGIPFTSASTFDIEYDG